MTYMEQVLEIVLRPAPVLGTISEEAWNEFKGAVSSSIRGLERDTEAEIFLHLVGDDEQPIDVRRRAIWELGKNGNSNYLSVGVYDSKDSDFVDSAIGQLDNVFASSGALLRYGTELALEFYESGQDRQFNTSSDHSAAILLSAAMPNLGKEPKLLPRALNALAGIHINQGSARESLITDSIGRTLIDKRVPSEQRVTLMDGTITYDDGTARHSLLNMKAIGAMKAATDHFNTQVHDSTILRRYFDKLATAISGGDFDGFSRGLVPAGLERIGKLEGILGAKHPYVQLIVDRGIFSTRYSDSSASEDEVKQALESARILEDPQLRQRAYNVAHRLRVRQLEQAASYEARLVASKQLVNTFLQRQR